ncbi:BTB/POZ domain-containing protein, partial [Gigaspora rosea]
MNNLNYKFTRISCVLREPILYDIARIYICRMITKFFETLSNNYLEIFGDNDDDEDFNVIINVGGPLNSKIYKAHSVVLKYRSSYFRNKLANAKTDDNNVKTINLKHVSIQQFEIIIKYIYGGIISIEQHDAKFIFELMLIASELLLEELVKYLETHLIEEKAHWLRLQFSRIYHKSFQNDKLQKLQEWCNNIAAKYPDKVFESSDFTILQENALISLISRDDLQMKEVKIWNHVIKWGIAQNPGLPSDFKTWSLENFLTLKTTLQNFLHLIRYFQMSA